MNSPADSIDPGIKATFAFSAQTRSTGVARLTKPFLKTPADQSLEAIGWQCK